MSNFVLYFIGTLIVAGALAFGAAQMGVPQVWIWVGALVIVGFGIMAGVSKTRKKEDPDA